MKKARFFVIPGEDPGSSVQWCLFQSLVDSHGSRIKSGMTVLSKYEMTVATD